MWLNGDAKGRENGGKRGLVVSDENDRREMMAMLMLGCVLVKAEREADWSIDTSYPRLVDSEHSQ